MKNLKGVSYIEKLTREDFLRLIVRGVAKEDLFSRMVSMGPKEFSTEELGELKHKIKVSSVPVGDCADGEDIFYLCRKIARRVVQLR